MVLLCQGRIAPDFAGVDIGLAERLAARAVASAAGVPVDRVLATTRGDRRPGSRHRASCWRSGPPTAPTDLLVSVVFDTLHEIAAAAGPGRRVASWTCSVGLLDRATPL